MPFTGSEVIEGARGLDPSFSRQRYPSKIALEFLARYQKRLHGKMLQVEKESISSEISISLPLADFAAGAELVDGSSNPLQYDRIHGFNFEDSNGDDWPLIVVPFKDRLNPPIALYGWMRENVLFLSGVAANYTQYSEIQVTYAPTPGAVTLAGDMILPDSSLDVVVLALGAEMGKRSPEDLKRTTIVDEAKEAEEDFLNLIEERNDTEIGTVRRVFYG